MTELVDFYQVEMVKKDWQYEEAASVVEKDEGYAALNFTNDTEECWVSITVQDNETIVTLIVTDK